MVAPENEASRQWTVELLVALAQASLPGLRALVTARRDLLDPLLGMSGLGKSIVRGTLLVEPMTDATWHEVVHQALQSYGYDFEDEALGEELLEQLRGTAGAMPLVQFALTELWNKRDVSAKRVTRAGLAAIGGISGSLERHAEATVQQLASQGVEAMAGVRLVLLELTTPQGTRTTATRGEITRDDPARARNLRGLEAARLVVDADGGVTLAHDALLVQWQRLRGWLAEVREQRLLAAELERDARRWALDPEGVAPWRKRRLATARDLAAGRAVALSEPAHRFLAAGRKAERRGRALLVSVSLLVATLGAATGGTYVLRVRADNAAAQERAEHESSRASLELSRRVELEKAQSELDGRQSKIDALVAQLSQATDAKTIEDVQRRMKEEQVAAHSAQRRIAAARSPSSPASPPTPVARASATPSGPKVQREE